MLKFRSGIISAIRDFFSSRGFLETDTPALSPALIPESCLEVFRTNYLAPKGSRAEDVPLFLLPSPELYMKKIIAAHGISIFQISKCYRNCEASGRLHSPEFTMLEYYKVGASYMEMSELTEELLQSLIPLAHELLGGLPAEGEGRTQASLQFERIAVDNAFARWASGALSATEGKAPKTEEEFLASLKARLSLRAAEMLQGGLEKCLSMEIEELFDILFIHCVEPEISRRGLVFLTDYPAFVNALAAENPRQGKSLYRTRQRWELYAGGIELANCYTEERNKAALYEFFKKESIKKKGAQVPHPCDKSFAELCAASPACSGVAMGIDRLLMFLSGKKSIESVLPFPLEV